MGSKRCTNDRPERVRLGSSLDDPKMTAPDVLDIGICLAEADDAIEQLADRAADAAS